MSTNHHSQPPIHPFFQPRRPQAPPPSRSLSKTELPTATYLPPAPRISENQSDVPRSIPTNPSTLPAAAAISQVHKDHVQPLRRINSLLLPISYPDSFYKKILTPESSFSRVITWQDSNTSTPKVIGGIVCRIDPALAPTSTAQAPAYEPGVHDVYIASLALLSPYRGKGLVASVLDQVIEAATTQQELRIGSLYAHVWTQNEEALQWYAARGFKKEGSVIQGYYRRLNPGTAWIFRRRLNPSDHLQHSFQTAQAPALPAQGSVPAPQPPPPTPAQGLTVNRPAPPAHARSFQERGPDREWNDLPDEVLHKARSVLAYQEGSAASSRSSSKSATDRGKKKRVYPTAAYGA